MRNSRRKWRLRFPYESAKIVDRSRVNYVISRARLKGVLACARAHQDCAGMLRQIGSVIIFTLPVPRVLTLSTVSSSVVIMPQDYMTVQGILNNRHQSQLLISCFLCAY